MSKQATTIITIVIAALAVLAAFYFVKKNKTATAPVEPTSTAFTPVVSGETIEVNNTPAANARRFFRVENFN